jgi:hypothetical protein
MKVRLVYGQFQSQSSISFPFLKKIQSNTTMPKGTAVNGKYLVGFSSRAMNNRNWLDENTA